MLLLKHPGSIEYQSVIAAILSDLGVTANEVSTYQRKFEYWRQSNK